MGPGKKAREQAVVGWFGDRGKEEGEGEERRRNWALLWEEEEEKKETDQDQG